MFECPPVTRCVGGAEAPLTLLVHGLGADFADTLAAAAATGVPDASVAGLVGGIDTAGLSEAGRVNYLLAVERLARWIESLRMAALVEHVYPEAGLGESSVTAELERRGRVADVAFVWEASENHVRNEACVAADLLRGERFGDAVQRLRQGEVSRWHLRILAELTEPLTDAQALAVTGRVLDKAEDTTPGQFRRVCRRAVTRVEPEAIVQRHARAVADRQVRWWPELDGMATLQLRAPAPDVQAVFGALTLLAGPPSADDPRSVGARRCDALLQLCLDAVLPDFPLEHQPEDQHTPGDQHAPTGPSRRHHAPVEAHIVIDLATLLGLADNPAELRGYGSIPAGLARDWLHEADTWRRLVTDPVTGHLLDYGQAVRFAPDTLRAFLAARDGTCSFPGCVRRADSDRTEMDHHPPWRDDGTGGSTSATQMAALCKHHHQLRTHGGWQITDRADGVTRWRSPTGRALVTKPDPVLD